MEKIKRYVPFAVVIAAIFLIYSFFHISGYEIRFIDELSDNTRVTVIVSNEKTDDKTEYELSKKQTALLKKLIEENSYTRRISSTIIGALPEKRYTIFATWNDNSLKHLQISLLGGEYIQILGEYGSHYHKIKNPDFENELISILNMGAKYTY